MRLKLVVANLGFMISSAFAANAWLSAATAYTNSNLNSLTKLHQTNAYDEIVNYFYASANLIKTNPTPAQNFVANNPDSYYRNELIHQLLTYYFTNQEWGNYLKIYPQLPAKQVSSNEKCGYDVANFALNTQQPLQSNLNEVMNNKMPLWCISLIASKLKNGSLAKTWQTPFFANLISNGQTFQFNQVAPEFGVAKVNFNSNIPCSKFSNPYQIIYRISNLSNKAPDKAFNAVTTSTLNRNLKQFLYNLIAADLATKQMFELASTAIDLGNNSFISDDELEWRVRTYLALGKYAQVSASIELMPDYLKNKNVWRYWHAYAAAKQGLNAEAHSLINQIPLDFSYYSLLAQAELKKPLGLDPPVNPVAITQIKYNDEVQQSFSLYKLGKQNANSALVRLATQSLYYIISQLNDPEIAAISRQAHSIGWHEMGIAAANRMHQPTARLSFPLLFTTQYYRYSQAYDLPMSYPMAITRQESRFNPNALAFDGGVGLMQIMPATASYIAKKTSSSNCYQNFECNIKFGSWFLAHLLTKFGNNYIYASAGYNAGPGRAHHWQLSFNNLDNRIQIELIPFKITRDYVQKVLVNKLIYDKLLNNAPNWDMLSLLTKINPQLTTFIVDDDTTSGDASGAIIQQ